MVPLQRDRRRWWKHKARQFGPPALGQISTCCCWLQCYFFTKLETWSLPHGPETETLSISQILTGRLRHSALPHLLAKLSTIHFRDALPDPWRGHRDCEGSEESLSVCRCFVKRWTVFPGATKTASSNRTTFPSRFVCLVITSHHKSSQVITSPMVQQRCPMVNCSFGLLGKYPVFAQGYAKIAYGQWLGGKGPGPIDPQWPPVTPSDPQWPPVSIGKSRSLRSDIHQLHV